MRVSAVFDSIYRPYHVNDDDGWSKETEEAICLLFGIALSDTRGFFTDAAGTDYVALAREKARLAAGDDLADGGAQRIQVNWGTPS